MLPLTPPKLGRYEIVDEIGKGAMGVVYLARDPLIGRLVALKTFRIGYSVKDHEMEQFRVRFMREAQSAGILSHPHIVTIHDVMEQTDEGMAFIAMEYVRGTTLKAMLQSDQTFSLAFVVDVISQVAEALDYAHSHRVIHRDVKPANILITADNRVKITDFGIARLDTSNLTQEGQLLGTPNYMAPEQIQGKEVDHRADLFALGVVLYEMLTRHKPFQGENLTVVSHRIVYDQFTPPRDYAKELPPGLERILDRALEKDPARRYQRARDMVEDLRRMLAETSRDDLNETLSIATWGAGVVPPPPGPAGGGTTTAASPGSPESAAVPPAAPPKPAKAPALPKPARGPRPPLSFKRVGLYAALGALILVLAVAALRLGVAWSGGKPVNVEASEDAKAVRYRGLVQEGEALVKQLKYTEAIQAFSRALEIAPDDKEKARLTQRLQDLSVEYQGYIATLGRSGQILAYLEEARNAYENERYSDAAKAANSVLALDAANADALKMKSDAEAAQARLRQQKARSAAGKEQTPHPQVAGVTPVPEASPSPEVPVQATENQKCRLRISIQAEVPEVTLRIDGKDGRLFSKTFRGERVGLLRKAKPVNAADAIDVAAGMYKLQILVVPGGKAGQTEVLNANFPGGGSRSLQIRVTAAGVVSVNLD
jgi:tRNA A-37 threonylcarbamoyl transferase component Bud32/tetratricopeptide (TPR) repeat protein